MNPKALAAGLALGFVLSAPSAQAIIVNSDNGSAVFITETVDLDLDGDGRDEAVHDWDADAVLAHPEELLNWLGMT